MALPVQNTLAAPQIASIWLLMIMRKFENLTFANCENENGKERYKSQKSTINSFKAERYEATNRQISRKNLITNRRAVVVENFIGGC